MRTSIGIQVFVRQSNNLFETHFVHCEEVDHALKQRTVETEYEQKVNTIVEGYVQEARLSRWAFDFN